MSEDQTEMEPPIVNEANSPTVEVKSTPEIRKGWAGEALQQIDQVMKGGKQLGAENQEYAAKLKVTSSTLSRIISSASPKDPGFSETRELQPMVARLGQSLQNLNYLVDHLGLGGGLDQKEIESLVTKLAQSSDPQEVSALAGEALRIARSLVNEKINLTHQTDDSRSSLVKQSTNNQERANTIVVRLSRDPSFNNRPTWSVEYRSASKRFQDQSDEGNKELSQKGNRYILDTQARHQRFNKIIDQLIEDALKNKP